MWNDTRRGDMQSIKKGVDKVKDSAVKKVEGSFSTGKKTRKELNNIAG